MKEHYRLHLLLLIALVFVERTEIILKSDESPSKSPSGLSRQSSIVWSDPGPVETLDLVSGPGGRARAPRPPFTFVKEPKTGTSPKVEVIDAQKNNWIAKFGSEVNAEVFATRIAWAVGYFVDATYFVPSGKIVGAKKLERARNAIETDGTFANACFELREKNATFLKKSGWTWQNNPFVGTRELNGLKIVMMLTSNWDNKDARNDSSNLGILQYPENGSLEWRYLVTDWGGSMGKWGRIFTREKWDCDGFTEQTQDFIKGVKDGKVEWGYTGKHTSGAKDDITLGDVKWLLGYLGRLTDHQIIMGLQASGATKSETQCFAKAIRNRIDQMKRLVAREQLSLRQSNSHL